MTNAELFSTLGFNWNRALVPGVVPTHSIERVTFRFHRMLPEFVWDTSELEGNPFTYPEVKTLLDGVTIGGRRISDQVQVLNLAASSRHLLALVKAGKFSIDKATLNGILMSAGIDASSVPAGKAQEFNENMVRFYLTKDATETMVFLVDCHPEAAHIHQTSPNCTL